LDLPDDRSWLRRRFIRQYFTNHAETLDYYLFLLKLGRRFGPLDWVVKEGLGKYMSENLHSTVVVPLEEMMELVDGVGEISVSRCICRVHFHKCDQGTWNCFFVNSGATEHAKVHNRYNKKVTKEEAKEIIRASYEKGLVSTVDWCVYPYTYGICCCCRDCCVPTRMRVDYGLRVALVPTHRPVLVGSCVGCNACVERCETEAVSYADGLFFDLEKCIGCGQCAYVCPEKAIEMERMRPLYSRGEFSTFRLGVNYVFFTTLVLPGLLLYTFVNGVIRRKYPKEEFLEWGEDAHGPYSVHEV
jgi:ferredoxin